MQLSTLADTTCYHCGKNCTEEIIVSGEHTFCCVGCNHVYELLTEHNLCDYYAIERTPGVNRSTVVAESSFDYLNDADVRRKLIQFSNSKLTRVTFFLPLVHCSSCIWLLERLSKLDARIIESRLHFPKKQIHITFDSGMKLSEVALLLTRIGYEPAIHLDQLEQEKKSDTHQTLIYKIGVAGFCFGNIMLISFPEYFGLDSLTKHDFSRLFGWLNLVLSLPVFFYSATDYFKKAWYQIKSLTPGIDVPLALGILVMFLRSTIEVVYEIGPGYFDTHAGLVFFLLIGKWFQQKSYDQLSFERDYKAYFPIAANVIQNGVVQSTPVTKLEIGNRILVKNNELIPADAILLKGEAQIDYSFVTGESEPVLCSIGEIIYAGGKQTGQQIELDIIKSVSQSYLTQLWNKEEFGKQTISRLHTFQQKISYYFTYILLVLAIGGGVYWYIQSNAHTAIHVFTSVLIIACPCALALSSPFALGTALHLFGKKGFYIKSPDVIEHMAKMTAIVFDKTGTITQPSQARIEYSGISLDACELMILSNMAKQSIHPVSKQIAQYCGEQPEIVFDTFEEITGRGLIATFQSAVYKLGSAKHTDIQTEDSHLVTHVFFTRNGNCIGQFALNHTMRSELPQVIAQLKPHAQLHVLSGDNDKQKNELSTFFKSDDIHFNQSPEDKLHYIRKLKEQHVVMMIGDGLNDAGALKAADIGVSLTEDTTHFTPASDVIFDSAHFALLPHFIHFSKQTLRVIYGSFCISLLYNIVGLTFALQGKLSPVFAAVIMPLSSVSVIAFTTAVTWMVAKRNHII